MQAIECRLGVEVSKYAHDIRMRDAGKVAMAMMLDHRITIAFVRFQRTIDSAVAKDFDDHLLSGGDSLV